MDPVRNANVTSTIITHFNNHPSVLIRYARPQSRCLCLGEYGEPL